MINAYLLKSNHGVFGKPASKFFSTMCRTSSPMSCISGRREWPCAASADNLFLTSESFIVNLICIQCLLTFSLLSLKLFANERSGKRGPPTIELPARAGMCAVPTLVISFFCKVISPFFVVQYNSSAAFLLLKE